MNLPHQKHNIDVSIVYAEKQHQWLENITVPRGTTAQELIEQSGLLQKIPSLAEQPLESLNIGVYSEKVDLNYLLEQGDRLEIYRPLTADPKEVRRQLALMGKTMGKS